MKNSKIISGNFNFEFNQTCKKPFCGSYSLRSFVKKTTCFKNPENLLCIGLILTISPKSFQNSCAKETGLPNFHKMYVTGLKMKLVKMEPNIVHYRDYKNFFLKKMKAVKKFLGIFFSALDGFTPHKK